MRTIFLLVTAGLLVSSCGVSKRISEYNNRATFGGKYYKARINSTKDDRLAFVATISPVSQGLDDARDAGRFEAIKYCVGAFGNSNIEWRDGPDAEETALRISDNVLTLEGRCAP
ncbi:MAG: hypothetical protein JXR13_18150 [Thalassovita sp.]